MLRLTRLSGERIMIGDDIILEVGFIRDRAVELRFYAPTDIPIYREEIYKLIQAKIQAEKEDQQ
ncbi:MAG: carbon storage regulator [Gammaproteobacteria bacterium]|nr:carbon storage regulator [Gammaproteobacteria bacterium]